MQISRVDHPGDERPGLLRVPAPVAAPGRLGPDRTGDDREGVDRESEGGRPVRHPVEYLGLRHPRAQRHREAGRRPAGLDGELPPATDQVEQRRDRAHQEDAGPDGDGRDVDGDPVRPEGGHQRRGLGVEHRAAQEQQHHDRQQDEHAEVAHLRLLDQNAEEGQHTDGADDRGELHHVAPRPAVRRQSAGGQ